MSYAYNELFWGKASIYCLVDNGQRWEDKGTGGQLRLYRNKTLPNDVQIGWFKDAKQLWWRLAPGKHAKLRGKGPRAWVVKANSTNSGEQETLAIRFSTEPDSTEFERQYNLIFSPMVAQQQQQQQQLAQQMEQMKQQMQQQAQFTQQMIAQQQMQQMQTMSLQGYGSNPLPQMPNSVGSMPQMSGGANALGGNNGFQQNGYGMVSSSMPQQQYGAMGMMNGGFQQQQQQQQQQQYGGYPQQQQQQQQQQQNPYGQLTHSVSDRHVGQQHQQQQRMSNHHQQPNLGQIGHSQTQRVSLTVDEGQNQPQPPALNVDLSYQQPAKSSTTWECGVCTYNNAGERLKCGLCGMARRRNSGDSSVVAPAIPATPHNQQQRTGFPFPKDPSQTSLQSYGSGVGSPQVNQQPPQLSQQQSQQQEPLNGGWRCPVCTLVNDGASKSCEACNKPRPNKRVENLSPTGFFGLNFGKPQVQVYVDEDDEPDQDQNGMVNIGMGSAQQAHQMIDDLKIADNSSAFGGGMGGGTVAPRDRNGNIISSAKDFEGACSDIIACNPNPSPVFNTLKSVSRKLTKDDVRYRTLDLQNPRVVERLIGYEGVLDFLTLLGFAPDENGIKLVCENKPNIQVVKNAVEVLQSYENKLGFAKPRKPKNNNTNTNDVMSDGSGTTFATPGQGGNPQDMGNPESVQEEEDNEMSIDQVIAWGTHEHARDTESINTLIMTHILYSDSLSLLRSLRRRYFVAIPGDIRDSGDSQKIQDFQENVQKRIQLKVLKALKDWMKTYWESDFANNEELRKEVLSFVEQMEKKQDECPWNTKFAGMIRNDFTKYCDRGAPRRPSGKKLNAITLPKNFDITNMKKIKAEEFADQLTLMDFSLFEKIESRECLGQAWKKKDSIKRAPNIIALIKQFNSITTMIQMHILNENGLSKRGKRLGYIIKMGERFREIHNYNALCAVFSALNSAPIHRLKTLWKKLSEKENKAFQGWRQIFDSGGNHRNLRASLRSATGACIPHIGIFLQDLVFIEDGNGTKKQFQLDESKQTQVVNFAKQLKLADRIQYIHRYQQVSYDFKENDIFQKGLQEEFEKYKSYTEDEIWEISTAIKKADK